MSNSSVQTQHFDVYGFRFSITGAPGSALSGICQDFAYFSSESAKSDHRIEMIDSAPDFGNLPDLEATIYTPRNVVYRCPDQSYIDYQGSGLGVHDHVGQKFTMYSENPDLRYEAVYLFLLSQIGKYLDERGMHRVHALAVSISGRAILVLLPGGGGKSTLALELLKHKEVSLLSDDSPFVDQDGNLHAFPLRLGLLEQSASGLSEKDYRVIQRMEFGPKVLLNYEKFAHRILSEASPGLILLGARTLASTGRLQTAGLWKGFRAMTANCIVGLGLFQGLEFILSTSPWELLTRVGLVASRTRASWRLLRRSRVYTLKLGRSAASNAQAVMELARALSEKC